MKKSLYLKGYILKCIQTKQPFVSMPKEIVQFMIDDEWEEVKFFCGGCYE